MGRTIGNRTDAYSIVLNYMYISIYFDSFYSFAGGSVEFKQVISINIISVFVSGWVRVFPFGYKIRLRLWMQGAGTRVDNIILVLVIKRIILLGVLVYRIVFLLMG